MKMLFKQEHKQMILDGKKTATRRAWKKPMVKVGGIYKCKLKMLSKKYFAKIEVMKLYKQKLRDMKSGDCKKEGYPDRQGYPEMHSFVEVWEMINGKWSPNQEVYVIEFKLVKNSPKG